MSDRTSSAIYGDVFEALAKAAIEGAEKQRLARLFWRQSFEYDFSPEQMCCDKALLKLDLAQRCATGETRYRTQNGEGWE